MLKLTLYTGKPVLINPKYVISVRTCGPDDGCADAASIVYCTKNLQCFVKEDIDVIAKDNAWTRL